MSELNLDPLDPVRDFAFGYCTNVHAGVTLEAAKENLARTASQVQKQLVPHGKLPVGLWLAQNAAEQLTSADAVNQFGDWLAAHGLKPYTFNGFPQGDFHQPVVKHAVYEPTWLERSRLDYTQQLVDILAALLDERHGSISTLPLGWPTRAWTVDEFRRAGEQLRQLAQHMNRTLESTGKEIVLAIEPEPGCVIDTAYEMVEFLEGYVFDSARPFIRRHIGVCHDICHSAVMFEPQVEALNHYLAHGVRIGKVQVSSAVEVPWRPGDAQLNQLISTQLKGFNEPRYLHQTTRHSGNASSTGAIVEMVDDLPHALEQWLNGSRTSQWPEQPWRVHFHVPIFVERFGHLKATRDDIHLAVEVLESNRLQLVEGAPWFTGDYEVETYAWGVLPAELRVDNLADGIAKELSYFENVLKGVQR